MKSKTGIILMLAGGAAIIFSLIIIAENIRLDSQGKKNSENVLNILESEISSYSEDENNITYTDGNGLKKSKTINYISVCRVNQTIYTAQYGGFSCARRSYN